MIVGYCSHEDNGPTFPLGSAETIPSALPEVQRRAPSVSAYAYVLRPRYSPPFVLCSAGADASDEHPGVPPVDGLNMWPYITGRVKKSPRTEMMLSNEVDGKGVVKTAALIVNNYKLILGSQMYGFWQGPVYPNASTDHKHEPPVDCTAGASICLLCLQPSGCSKGARRS